MPFTKLSDYGKNGNNPLYNHDAISFKNNFKDIKKTNLKI